MKRWATVVPLRLWLAVALTAIVAVPVLATWAMSALTVWQQQQADSSRISSVRQLLGTDAASWSDLAWQRRAAATLGAEGIELRLVDGDGSQVFITRGARQILSTYTGWSPPSTSFGFDKIAIARPENPRLSPEASVLGKHASTTSTVIGTASLWFTRAAPGSPPPWLVQVAAATALVLTLAGVAWLLGRAVVRPLAAMSRAVDQIAGGDLDLNLPTARAREVAQVGTALAGLSATLRASLGRQARLEEERRLLISAIAHDLRTPLFMLRGYLKGLETGVAKTPEKIAQYVQACSTRADALEKLIADLFAYTRLEYVDQGLRREPFAVDELLREAVESTQAVASAKDVTLRLEGAPAGCLVAGDAALLGRAVQNLLDNAVRHTPGDGTIEVRWRRDGPWVVMQVQDSGPGIAPHDLAHLFTPLYRGEASRNRQTGGAGLGLSLAQRIFQAHGGDLSAANTPHGGAMFTGTLPTRSG